MHRKTNMKEVKVEQKCYKERMHTEVVGGEG